MSKPMVNGVRAVVCVCMIVGFCGQSSAQELRKKVDIDDSIAVKCMDEDTSRVFCDMVEFQVHKRFPISPAGNSLPTYKLLVGMKKLFTVGEVEVSTVWGVVTKTVFYPSGDEEGTLHLADDFQGVIVLGHASGDELMKQATIIADSGVSFVSDDTSKSKP